MRVIVKMLLEVWSMGDQYLRDFLAYLGRKPMPFIKGRGRGDLGISLTMEKEGEGKGMGERKAEEREVMLWNEKRREMSKVNE